MDCLEPAPTTFRISIHSIHFISFPIYILALISLIFIKSNVFTTYRLFLIWHVLENIHFEVYSSFMVAPVLHAPYPLVRTTGFLSKIGFSNLAQFYILALSIEFNGTSVSEMFYFRYKASIMNYKDSCFTYFLKFFVYLTRFIAVFDVVFCIVTSSDAFQFQQEHRLSLYKQNPSDHFLSCGNIYLMTTFKDYVSSIFLGFWILQSAVLFISIPGTATFISFNLPKTISEVTIKVQHQLLRSLIIQASIHAIMLGIPNVMFIYAFLFGYENETTGYIAFVCLTYHGFVSSFVLIVFTKPLRQYLMIQCKLKKAESSKVSVTSYNKRTSVY
ncbi:hypothetical protein CAEBREN_17364 [Caenorhabditis brenneri]|uniref:Serpentine Receptor, class H n=1 Tax=Caenorhabditis brenneri TaxID=135651 RepID=G0MTQ7_CAEBE|nr:hypothetical protein CAEBREN_17364 [Caenorhabditis brenneri]